MLTTWTIRDTFHEHTIEPRGRRPRGASRDVHAYALDGARRFRTGCIGCIGGIGVVIEPPRNTRMPYDGTPQSAAARRLDRHIEKALRQDFGARANLRNAVRQLATQLSDAGASDDAIRALLRRSVDDHPQRHACDRVSIVTGLRRSEILTQQMLDWMQPPADDVVSSTRSHRRAARSWRTVARPA
jgi:hypothetical protein